MPLAPPIDWLAFISSLTPLTPSSVSERGCPHHVLSLKAAGFCITVQNSTWSYVDSLFFQPSPASRFLKVSDFGSPLLQHQPQHDNTADTSWTCDTFLQQLGTVSHAICFTKRLFIPLTLGEKGFCSNEFSTRDELQLETNQPAGDVLRGFWMKTIFSEPIFSWNCDPRCVWKRCTQEL